MKVRELIKILADCPFMDNHITISTPAYPDDRFHISEVEFYDKSNSANSILVIRSYEHVLTDAQVTKAEGNIS